MADSLRCPRCGASVPVKPRQPVVCPSCGLAATRNAPAAPAAAPARQPPWAAIAIVALLVVAGAGTAFLWLRQSDDGGDAPAPADDEAAAPGGEAQATGETGEPSAQPIDQTESAAVQQARQALLGVAVRPDLVAVDVTGEGEDFTGLSPLSAYGRVPVSLRWHAQGVRLLAFDVPGTNGAIAVGQRCSAGAEAWSFDGVAYLMPAGGNAPGCGEVEGGKRVLSDLFDARFTLGKVKREGSGPGQVLSWDLPSGPTGRVTARLTLDDQLRPVEVQRVDTDGEWRQERTARFSYGTRGAAPVWTPAGAMPMQALLAPRNDDAAAHTITVTLSTLHGSVPLAKAVAHVRDLCASSSGIVASFPLDAPGSAAEFAFTPVDADGDGKVSPGDSLRVSTPTATTRYAIELEDLAGHGRFGQPPDSVDVAVAQSAQLVC